MSNKQIFSAIEIADHEVRMVVGEFFNTRFNILKVEHIPTSGITYNEITDPEQVTKAIMEAAEETKKNIGAPIERVILAIPAVNTKRKSLRVTVPVEGIDGTVTVQDIRNAIKNAQSVKIDKDSALIETLCVKYTIDGIASRRLPLGERASNMTVDVDLLLADRKMTYDLVSCVENAGLSVMDIFLDVSAASKEAALFEQSVDRNVVLLKMEREATIVALLAKGRLCETTVVPLGVGNIASQIVEKCGIQREEACELVKYNSIFNKDKYSDSTIYIWTNENGAQSITEKELHDIVAPKAEEWVSTMEKLCGGILQAGTTTVIITGEGGEMTGISELLEKRLGCEVRNYIPETLGGRNAAYTACLGLFYAFKDKLPITGYTDNSVDLDTFLKAVSRRDNRDDKEDTFTGKLKSIFSNKK